MTDCLYIKELCVSTHIGVHNWEQKINQSLFLDISIEMDFHACNDELSKTVDYDALCQFVTSYVESRSFNLIETVANSVADCVKQEFGLSKITVSVSKPHAIRNAKDIRVQVVR